MKRIPWAGVLVVSWLALTGALGECSFFQPAAPEPPRGSAIIPDYSTPTRTLETIAKAIADKNNSNGQDAYVRAFAESTSDSRSDGRAYHGFFDLEDLLSHTRWPRDRDWNRELERAFYGVFVRLYSAPFEMRWEPYEPAGNETGSDRDSILHRKYRIEQLVGTGSSITRIPLATGAADLYFVRSANALDRWVITRWQDYHTLDADSARVTLGSRRLDTQ